MRELKLRYFIDLVSNVAARARADAQVVQQTQTLMQRSITGTTSKFDDWSGSVAKGAQKTAVLSSAVTQTAGKLDNLSGSATRSAQTTAVLVAAITGATSKFDNLDRVISRVGSNTSAERQVGYMRRLTQSIDQAEGRAVRLRQALANGLERAPEVAGAAVAGYYGGKRVVAPFVGAYSDLESATTDLKISMTNASGQVSKDFEKIGKEAVALGNQLPGTTKDFMLAARGLQVQGVPSTVIANGGLRASSYVGALLNLNQEQAAETIAKLREAHGLKENELVPAADLVQRAYFGFGIKLQDYLETAKYSADTYNAMGIKGIDQTRETLAIQGMAANVGLEGSSFGTNYAGMLRRLGQMDTRLNKKSAEAKEAKAMLDDHGIDMQFYDAKGVFKGNLNMLQELAKLRSLSPLEQQHVTNKVFGVEASRPAQILISKGLEGYNAALATINDQANLDQRIEMKMTTFASKLEALGGTITNVQAQIASQLGEASKPMMDRMSEAVSGPLQGFFERNPTAGTVGLVGAGAAGAYLSGRIGMGLIQKFIGGAPAAATVAGAAVEAGASGGVPAAKAAASGISRFGGLVARGLAGLNPLMLLEMLSGPSDEDIQKLYAMDRRKAGFRGNGFGDPRRVDGQAVTVPVQPVKPVVAPAPLFLAPATTATSGPQEASLLPTAQPQPRTVFKPVMPMAFNAPSLSADFWAKKDPAVRQAETATAPGRAKVPEVGRLEVPQMPFLVASAAPVAVAPSPPAPPNWRGREFNAPRRLDFVSLTAPGVAPAQLKPGQATEIKVGEGRISLDVRVSDERVTVVPTVTQQPSLVRIDAGNTNPGGFRR